MIWLRRILSVGIFTAGLLGCVEGCKYFDLPKNEQGDVPSAPDVTIDISFFVNCLGASAGNTFPSLKSVINFVIRDSKWFKNVHQSLCKSGESQAECWIYALVFLIDKNSRLYEPTANCFCEYAGDCPSAGVVGGTVKSNGLNSDRTKKFSECVGQDSSEYIYLYQSLEDFDAESVSIFLQDHYTYCRSTMVTSYQYSDKEKFQPPELRKNCPNNGGRSQWRSDVVSTYEDATRTDGPVWKAYESCKAKLDDGTLLKAPSTLSIIRGVGGCMALDRQCSVADTDGSLLQIITEEDCKVNEKCCWTGDACRTKLDGSGDPGYSEEEDVFGPPPIEEVVSRGLGSSPFSKCTVEKPFPRNCDPRYGEPYVYEPPYNIPYCARIPCSQDNTKQKLYDREHKSCGKQPGCYFDDELYKMRDGLGLVLPGVPVCHLAIRSSVFQREAQKAIDLVGLWSPYYTNCLLNTFEKELMEVPDGCKMLPMLRVFNIHAKMAGWKGITPTQCRLIDCCWSPGWGCFYPVDPENIVVKSGQSFRSSVKDISYGRPKCQRFDSRTPYSILKSYHECLLAGCTADIGVSGAYFNHLFSIGKTMSENDQWQFWQSVNDGKLGAYNLGDIIWKYKNESAEDFAPPPTPPPVSNRFNFPGIRGTPKVCPNDPNLPPNLLALAALRGKKADLCGPQVRLLGYRPCPPKRPVTLPQNIWCPYEPFTVPGYKPLKGSLFGCCDINPCYISKQNQGKVYSGPSHYYTEWSISSPCSKTCGLGTQKRYRKCIAVDQSKCTEVTEDVGPCEVTKCGKWTPWSDWSPRRCFGWGRQTRYRTCTPECAKCDGNGQETRVCRYRGK